MNNKKLITQLLMIYTPILGVLSVLFYIDGVPIFNISVIMVSSVVGTALIAWWVFFVLDMFD